MGVSTDGILAFGILFGEGEEPWEDDFEEWVAERLPDFPKEPPAPVDWHSRSDDEKDAWSAYWDAKREALDAIGVEPQNYCSCDYPMYALVVKKSCTVANRGYPEDVDIAKCAEQQDLYEEALLDAMARLGIDMPEGERPRWLLMSEWC